jgi:hypothetical protein
MSETNIERYRAFADRWRKEAGEALTDEGWRNCLALAEGYDRLIEIISPSAITKPQPAELPI